MARLGWILALAACALAQDPRPGWDDTPLMPDGKWKVHDPNRPYPAVVKPGPAGAPPSDAIVLFDGSDLSKWRGTDGKEPGWKVENGYVEVVNGAGDIWTKEEFGDCQLHLEWCTPPQPGGKERGRGDSGVFIMGRYEVQIFDSFENPMYADGSAAAMYGQYPPLVNASRPPREWQTYDIIFTAPRFKDGKLETPAYLTLLHNGVVVHNHAAFTGSVTHRALAQYEVHGPTGPLRLQHHYDAVRFRNVWIRPLKGYDGA